MSEEVIALFQLKVDPGQKLTIQLEAQLEDALADVIHGNQDIYAILGRITDVGVVKVLEPGETWQIIPADEETDEATKPSAVGEELKPEETYIPLVEEEQVVQLRYFLKDALLPVSQEINANLCGASICEGTNTLLIAQWAPEATQVSITPIPLTEAQMHLILGK